MNHYRMSSLELQDKPNNHGNKSLKRFKILVSVRFTTSKVVLDN